MRPVENFDPKGRWVRTEGLNPEQTKHLLALQANLSEKRLADGKKMERRALEDDETAQEVADEDENYDGKSVDIYFDGRTQSMKIVQDLEGDGYFLISAAGLKARKSASALVGERLARRATKDEV